MKTRRPIGHKDDGRPPTYQPTDERTFEYREDATAHCRTMTGWIAYPQFIGSFDLWVITAARRSWRHSPRILRTDGTVR